MTDTFEEVASSSNRVCAAHGCRKTCKHGVALHYFPFSKPLILKQWENFVKKKRTNWVGPKKYSTLCSDHFSEDCYPKNYELMKSFGQTIVKRTLLGGAIPTIHTENNHVIEDDLNEYWTKTSHDTPEFVKRAKTRMAMAADLDKELFDLLGDVTGKDDSSVDGEESPVEGNLNKILEEVDNLTETPLGQYTGSDGPDNNVTEVAEDSVDSTFKISCNKEEDSVDSTFKISCNKEEDSVDSTFKISCNKEEDSVDSSYKGYAGDDSEEIDDNENVEKIDETPFDDEKEEMSMNKEENSYGFVIEGVKSISPGSEFASDNGVEDEEDQSINDMEGESSLMIGDVKSIAEESDPDEIDTEDTTNINIKVNDNGEIEWPLSTVGSEDAQTLEFDTTNIKQEPVDDDDYIQEHDYFGGSDFNGYMNDEQQMPDTGLVTADDIGELDPSELVQYQDMFSITQTGRYKCKFCCCTVPKFMALKKHIDRLHQKFYSCRYCGQACAKSQDLAAHIKNSHHALVLERKKDRLKQMNNLGVFKKKVNNKQKHKSKLSFNKSSSSYVCMKADSANAGKTYKCKHCSRTFCKSQLLASHVQWYHQDEVLMERIELEAKKIAKSENKSEAQANDQAREKVLANSNRYPCRYCGKVFHVQQSMACHIKNAHRSDKNGPAIIKKKRKPKKKAWDLPDVESSTSDNEVTNTVENLDDKQEDNKSRNKIIFQQGKKRLKKQNVFLPVKQLKSSSVHRVMYKCPKCDETFKSKHNVKEHLNKDHPTGWCRYCPKTFYKPLTMQLHSFRHLGDVEWSDGNKFFCKLCKTPIPYNRAGVMHIRHHIVGKNPQGATLNLEKQILLECEYCGLPFVSRTNLVFHELRHKVAKDQRRKVKEEKRNRALKQKQSVQKEDVKPYTELTKCLKTEADVKTEPMQTEHVDISSIPFKCGMCEARFPNSQYLLHHMTLHMKGQYIFKVTEGDKAKDTANSMSGSKAPNPLAKITGGYSGIITEEGHMNKMNHTASKTVLQALASSIKGSNVESSAPIVAQGKIRRDGEYFVRTPKTLLDHSYSYQCYDTVKQTKTRPVEAVITTSLSNVTNQPVKNTSSPIDTKLLITKKTGEKLLILPKFATPAPDYKVSLLSGTDIKSETTLKPLNEKDCKSNARSSEYELTVSRKVTKKTAPSTSAATVNTTAHSSESTETGDSDVDSVLESSSDSECFSDDSDGEIKVVDPVVKELPSSKHKDSHTKKEPLSQDVKREPHVSDQSGPQIKNFKKQLNFTEGKWFECEHCTYLCHTKRLLEIHMKNHGSVKRMQQCPVCGRKFISKWHLSSHMKLHRSNEYECTKCGKTFETASLVLSHMENCQA